MVPTAAYFGFWGHDASSRDDYELRIYASQNEAIELGTELARQRTGKDALLTRDTAVWIEGLRDARTCAQPRGSSAAAPDCTVPKYFDYMFVGNVILFCPGRDFGDARNNCDELIAELH